jgi:hypothetical protein
MLTVTLVGKGLTTTLKLYEDVDNYTRVERVLIL